MTVKQFWLMKSEPDAFSIDDLRQSKGQQSMWDGVRNYEARNFMRDRMKVGDGVLFYHSNVNPPCIVGTAEIVSESYPDPTQFDPEDSHFDPKSTQENPRWYLVDVKFKQKFEHEIPRGVLQSHPVLKEMVLFKRNRLSITPVTKQEWLLIHDLLKTNTL